MRLLSLLFVCCCFTTAHAQLERGAWLGGLSVSYRGFTGSDGVFPVRTRALGVSPTATYVATDWLYVGCGYAFFREKEETNPDKFTTADSVLLYLNDQVHTNSGVLLAGIYHNVHKATLSLEGYAQVSGSRYDQHHFFSKTVDGLIQVSESRSRAVALSQSVGLAPQLRYRLGQHLVIMLSPGYVQWTRSNIDTGPLLGWLPRYEWAYTGAFMPAVGVFGVW